MPVKRVRKSISHENNDCCSGVELADAVKNSIVQCSQTIHQMRVRCRSSRTLPSDEWLAFIDQQEAMIDEWNKEWSDLKICWEYFKEHAIEEMHSHQHFNADTLPTTYP